MNVDLDSGTILGDFFDLLMQDDITPDPCIYKHNDPKERFRRCLNDAVLLVEYLEDKESFVRAYTLHLAKRLIYRLSHHGDTEMLLITNFAVTIHTSNGLLIMMHVGYMRT